MGTWNTKINGNDTFLDIYQNFFDLYNGGADPKAVSEQIRDDFSEMFEDSDDRHNSLFGLALAQWETKSLDPAVFGQVKEIIESGHDIKLWKELGADEKTLARREGELQKFLVQLSTEREKPKRRARPKFEFSQKELVNITAPDGKKTFSVNEHFTNGAYVHTGSFLNWAGGGGSIFYFTGQGRYISAKWRDAQTLEVLHDKDIVFSKKDESFFFRGDSGRVIYMPTHLRPVKDEE